MDERDLRRLEEARKIAADPNAGLDPAQVPPKAPEGPPSLIERAQAPEEAEE